MMNTICVLFVVILIESNLYSTVGHSQLEKLRYFPKVKLLQPKGFSVTIEGLDKIKHVNLYEEGNIGQRLRRSVNSNASNLLEERFGLLDPKHVCNRYQRQYVRIKDIDNSYIEKSVLVRGRLQTSRTRGKQCFLVLRQQEDTIQCFLHVAASTSKLMLTFASKITRESIIDVVGIVQKTSMEIKSCSMKWFEIFVQELWVVSKAEILPIQVVDCARPEIEYKGTNVVGVAKPDSLNISVNQDKKLDHRVLDLRTPANQAIFRIESAVCQMFRNILIEQGFMEIHTPKIINAASEGGANVFEVSYFKGSAYLAQSPQLYKQMAIAADFEKVFTIGAVFRAEESHTSRHLTEFVGLDLEMAIKQNYSEVLDVIESTFIKIFKMLDDKYTKEILTIREQYHSEPFQFTEPSPRIKYSEGLQMLKDAGVSLHYESDLTSQHERLLGKLVKERYKTDFFILDKYPISARPFYTMADLNNPNLSNSYDIFMRGEEVMSGAQRIHDSEVLKKSALRHNVDLNKIKPYIDAFRYGCSPHAGGGIGLERTVALFLGLENVRKTSLFPRDPDRLTP